MVTKSDLELVRAILRDVLRNTSPTGTEADTRIREQIRELIEALPNLDLPAPKGTQTEPPSWLRDLLKETRATLTEIRVTKPQTEEPQSTEGQSQDTPSPSL